MLKPGGVVKEMRYTDPNGIQRQRLLTSRSANRCRIPVSASARRQTKQNSVPKAWQSNL